MITPFALNRINYYEGSGKVPAPTRNPRMEAIIQDNFPPDSAIRTYPSRDLHATAPDIFFAEGEEKAERVILQGEAPDPFLFVDGQLTPVLS